MRQVKEFMLRIKAFIKYVASYCLNPMFRATVRYTKNREKHTLRDNWVLFEAYRGEKMADTPYAMFVAMLQDERYQDFTYIWTLNDTDNYYAKLYKHNPHVRICKRNSSLYVKALCEAKYVINNKAFPYFFIKREGQIHASTWHATAFKALGKDQGGTMGQFKNQIRNYVQTDYLVMPNKFTSDIMLTSNDVNEIFPGYVVEEGYPRNDLTINTKREDMMKLMNTVFSVDASKKIVLYAPTWRGETGNSTDITKELLANVKRIEQLLGDEYELLLKVHDLTARFIKTDDKKYDFRIVPDWMDSNEVLTVVDILITDYSSIFIDILVLDCPVIFYTYDLEEYIKDRGLYFDMNQMPGPNCATVEEVVAAVKNVADIKLQYNDQYQQMKAEFCGKEDGNASKRVNEIVFQGKTTENMYRSNATDQKKRILIINELDNANQENQQLVEFSNQLDYERYDLTVLLMSRVNAERTCVLRSLHKNTRVFYNMGIWNQTFKEYYLQTKMSRASTKDKVLMLDQRKDVYQMQYKRLVGMVQFDIGIVFGQAMTNSMGLMLMSGIEKKIAWIVAEVISDKNVSNKYLFSRFDKVVTMDDSKKPQPKLVQLKKLVNLSLPLTFALEQAKKDASYLEQAFDTMINANIKSKPASELPTKPEQNTRQQISTFQEKLSVVLNEVEKEHGDEVKQYNKQIMSQLYTMMDEEKEQ